MSDLIDTFQLAAHLHVKPATIRNWVRRGKIPCFRIGHRPLLFRVGEVECALQPQPAHGTDQRRSSAD